MLRCNGSNNKLRFEDLMPTFKVTDTSLFVVVGASGTKGVVPAVMYRFSLRSGGPVKVMRGFNTEPVIVLNPSETADIPYLGEQLMLVSLDKIGVGSYEIVHNIGLMAG